MSYVPVSLPQLFYFVGILQSPFTSGLFHISFCYPTPVVLVGRKGPSILMHF